MNAKWNHKDSWRLNGKNFMVEVSRHSEAPSPEPWGPGPQRWCVYAYIYPKHPHFAKFQGEQMWQDAATDMPLHGGPSFLRCHVNTEGNATSFQVGADYNHLHDEEFTDYETAEQAHEVFSDAEQLHAWLTKAGEQQEQA